MTIDQETAENIIGSIHLISSNPISYLSTERRIVYFLDRLDINSIEHCSNKHLANRIKSVRRFVRAGETGCAIEELLLLANDLRQLFDETSE